MQLSDDRQQASLEINGTYGAADLEGLIAQLSALRAAMTPPVPPTPPMTRQGDDAALPRAKGDPSVQVAVMRDGMTRFWVRHVGLGWFGFNLPVERASLLAHAILDLIAPRERSINLARVRRRHTDVSH